MQTYKTFKTYIKERKVQVPTLASIIRSNEWDVDQVEFQLINNYGAEEIGSGAFAYVYAGEQKEVVAKVVEDTRNDMFHKYAELAQKYRASNNLFPEVLDIIELSGRGAVYFIEHLTVAGDVYSKAVDFIHNDDTFGQIWTARLASSRRYNPQYIEVLRNDIEHGFTDKGRYLKEIGFDLDKYLDWCSKIDVLKVEYLDLHRYNYGFRDDGSMVLFDPVA
jgi:hypothetical protein